MILEENVDHILIDRQRLQARISELAAEISRDYAGAENLLLVCVLKGAVMFLSDLSRQLDVPHAIDFIGRAQLHGADERLLEAVCAGDAEGFFGQLKSEGDRRHVCGLPPIYLTLRLLEEARGAPAGYAICPADLHGTSFVSIAGVILH